MSVTVAHDGNRRVGDMTEEELDQCVRDLISWHKRHAELAESESCSPADFQALEKTIDGSFPEDLKAMLRQQNGGLYFYDFRGLSVEEIQRHLSQLLSSKSCWKEGWVPFAVDADDNLLFVDVSSDEGVSEYNALDKSCEKLGRTFIQYLEHYRDELLGGHMEFVDGVGVVEKSSKK